jgi:ABC-type anion transport system duplicated permease subunit
MDPVIDLAISNAVAQEEGDMSASEEQPTDESLQTSTEQPEENTVYNHEAVVVSKPSIETERQYPSLYDSYGTTLIAIVLAVLIISSVIGIVTYIYRKAKSDHAALTQFVTTMFALIAGVFIADKIIAGPSTELLNEQEALKVLEFIQQTCLMVFAYYFGTKAQPPQDGPPNAE